VAERIAADTHIYQCVICRNDYQEVGRQSWGMCGKCPSIERSEEEKAAIKKRLQNLR
jgi:hypothetical protein